MASVATGNVRFDHESMINSNTMELLVRTDGMYVNYRPAGLFLSHQKSVSETE